jgi:hypothetical protein
MSCLLATQVAGVGIHGLQAYMGSTFFDKLKFEGAKVMIRIVLLVWVVPWCVGLVLLASSQAASLPACRGLHVASNISKVETCGASSS